MKVADIKIGRLTDEQLKALRELTDKEVNKRDVVKKLSDQGELKAFHDELGKVAEELGVDTDDIRLAEMAAYTEDFPAFVVKVKSKLEEWKKEHATYQDPNNPENVWYSPDGSGNPPEWISDVAGTKPKKPKGKDNGAHAKAMDDWMKKIEQFRVNREEEKEAA